MSHSRVWAMRMTGCLPMTAQCKLQACGFFVGKDVLMTVSDEPLLTLDEAYRATFHFVNQYYQREPIVPFMLMLNSMSAWSENGDLRERRATPRLGTIG